MILDANGRPVDVEPLREEPRDPYEMRLVSFAKLVPKPPPGNMRLDVPLQPVPGRWLRFRLWLARQIVWWLRIDPEDI